MPRSRPVIRRRPGRPSPFPSLLLFLCGVLVGAAGFYFGCRDAGYHGSHGSERAEDEPAASAPRARIGRHGAGARLQHGRRAGSDPPPPPADGASTAAASTEARVEGVRLAVVIDDLGRSVDEVESLERLGVPLTYSVLPYEEQTAEVIAALRRHGDEILCHLPMEPVSGQNPGPGALRANMDAGELRAATAAALAAVPGAVGVNNHMGSRLSADDRSMHAVLGVLADRKLFFLDSRTSPESVGYRVALALGLPAAQRQVFLDGDQRSQIIREQFARMLAIARERGAAIAIGHPHPSTIETLADEVPRAKALGYRFVPVSELLDRPAAAH